MDVASLYTNVPHNDGLEALQYYLGSRSQQIPSTVLVLQRSKTILTKNDFIVLQRQGVSMGSPFSPNYANLSMGRFEIDYVYKDNK